MTEPKEIARIRAALEAGPTPGPWRYDYEPGYCGEIVAGNGEYVATFTDELDADHIAACNPTAMTALLAHMDAQAAEIEQLRGDAARIEALEKLHQSHMSTDVHLGRCHNVAIYQRTGIGSNLHASGHGKTVRDAIDAMKEQP